VKAWLRRSARLLWWTATLRLPRRLRERRAARRLRESGLFDELYYLEHYPDLARGRLDPVTHYIRHGCREGRDPHPLFDTSYYLERYPDVAESGCDPLSDFLGSGGRHGRHPHRWFDTDHYLRANPYVARAGMNPLIHYLRVGSATGRSPHPDFDVEWYRRQRPQVDRAGIDPLVHFVRWGERTGASPGPAPAVPAKVPEPASPQLVAPDPGSVPEPAAGRDTAVILHLFYPDLWPEIRGFLEVLGDDFDLFVSLCDETGLGFEDEIRRDFPRAEVRVLENRGRDIRPFLVFLQDDRLARYRYVFKMHSKKSSHRPDGDRWRRHLYGRLLGSPEHIRQIKRCLDADPQIGILGASTQLNTDDEAWGSNRERMEDLVVRMGVSPDHLSLSFFAGSMFWFRPAALRPLAELALQEHDFEPESGQLDGTLAHAVERLFTIAAEAAGYRVLAWDGCRPPASVPETGPVKRFRPIAFYLPQFHPIPENDAWWGAGFTEWMQAVKARPLYEGHVQPRIPRDLGFYDLRVPETRRAQADLARLHGIHGFCYYHYWFDGRRLLERPLDEVLSSGEPDFPFCICWANENWTLRLDGLDNEILMGQDYSLESNRRFIRDVIPILRDPRYLRYRDRPVLLVYRAREIPDLKRTLDMWRSECLAQGVGEIHLCAVRFWDVVDVASLGFDAAVDFPPHHLRVENIAERMPALAPGFRGLIYDYEEAARRNLEARGHGYEQLAHRGVMLAWDNTPRRGLDAHIAHGATPGAYRKWLTGVLEQELEHSSEPESLIFINAWNEWGEGAVLEPDQHFGSAFLEATRDALREIEARARERARHPFG